MKPIFRNSMFGFHKEDVYNFISKQSRLYEEKIKDLNEENARIESDLENERMNAFSFEEKMKMLSAIEEEVAALSLVVDEVIRCADFCDSQSNEMRTAFASIKERLKKAEAFREKAQKFDRLSGVLSSIFSGKEDPEESVSTDFESFGAENVSLPESDGMDRLREAIASLNEHYQKLNQLVTEKETNE